VNIKQILQKILEIRRWVGLVLGFVGSAGLVYIFTTSNTTGTMDIPNWFKTLFVAWLMLSLANRLSEYNRSLNLLSWLAFGVLLAIFLNGQKLPDDPNVVVTPLTYVTLYVTILGWTLLDICGGVLWFFKPFLHE